MTILWFIVGLASLIFGAEILVRGASRLAGSLGMSPLVIGLTVVAFGTSAPEFAVSVKSAIAGQASMAVGNVVGSNIFNVLFILGLAALICPLIVSKQLIRLDVPLMIAASVLVLGLARDRTFSRLDGFALFAILLGYIAFLIFQNRKVSTENQEPATETETSRSMAIDLLLIVGGLGLLVLGSRWLVKSAVTFAQWFDVSEVVIGLTILAVGTSLPEVVTSVIASLRGERDIAVGNVVGSNVFNLLGVLGLASLVSPQPIEIAPTVYALDLPFMTAVAFACLPIFFTGGVISRWEGGLLLAYYVAYTIYLIAAAVQHEALPMYRSAMFFFVIPLTILTLLVTTVQAFRRREPAGDDQD